MSVEQKVRDHFHDDAFRFDAIYEDKKGAFARWVDNVWRGVVRRRFNLTMQKLEPLKGMKVLDVGCGSGRYCLAFAERGASWVLGIDFAPAMIKLAQQHAERLGVADRCDFRSGKFPDDVPEQDFDYCTAMGFFDYIEDPLPLLVRMREITQKKMVMSFPKAVEWRVPVRRLRFWMSGCPLFLYTEQQVRDLLLRTGINNYELIVMDRDYIVIASR